MDSSRELGEPERKRAKRRAQMTAAERQAQHIEQMFEDPKRAMLLPEPPGSVYKVKPPPDMVEHVQGSSSGVGSGEFHVYKMMRRNESDRIQAMKYEAERAVAQEAFNRKRDAQAAIDDAKTSKNRARREKKKRAQREKKSEPQFSDTTKQAQHGNEADADPATAASPGAP